jgi:small subunit ribosomal protein S20
MRYRQSISLFRETLLHGTVEQAKEQLSGLYKLLDQVAASGTLHKNTAARYKSRLTARLNIRIAAAGD